MTRYKDYSELRSAIDRMFGLGGKLDGPSISDWKLVYVDYENDVLLVGDDPWEYVSLSLSPSLSLSLSHSLAHSHSPQITAQWYMYHVCMYWAHDTESHFLVVLWTLY